jgi:hypothetical protein
LANRLSRARRAEVRSAFATWFSPSRWAPYDMVMAVSALVLAVSVFVPWFEATVRIRGSAVSGFLINPRGTISGIGAHGYLWAVFAVALLQFAVLAARYVPDGRGFTLPGYRRVLVVASALSCIVVVVALVMKPAMWTGGNQLGDGFYIVVAWTYGSFAALAAAVISMAVAVTAIREHLAR